MTPTALRLAPSLLISDDEIDHGVAAISAVLDETKNGSTEESV